MKKVSSSLYLAKQNFKFSATHFLIFNKQSAERLHGHNYQVKVRIELPNENEFSGEGFHIDFSVFKKIIKAMCDEWDERVILPSKQEDMKLTEKGPSLEVRFRNRFYVFPKDEVVLLPTANTSVEEYSRLFAEKLLNELTPYRIRKLSVSVEETRGQMGTCTVEL